MLLRGVADPQALADAIGKVIAAHPAISAVISLDDDSNPVWRHGAPVSVEVERVSHEQLMNSLDALILPFNLEGGALSRIKIFDTDRGIYLFMDFHHTIYDGVSRNIFLRDIARALNGEELQPEETSIFDLGEEEAARRKSADYELDRDAWTELLKGAETETDRYRMSTLRLQGNMRSCIMTRGLSLPTMRHTRNAWVCRAACLRQPYSPFL